MIPQQSGSSSVPPRADPSHVHQSMHSNTFPIVVEFSGPPKDTTLDLNFSQRGAQNTVRMLNEADNGLQPRNQEGNDADTRPQEAAVGPVEGATPTSDRAYVSGQEANISKVKPFDTPSSRTRTAGGSSTPQKISPIWTLDELVVLFDAKKAQAEKAESGPRKLRSATPGKWEEVADSCKRLGVNKPAAHFREKWERLWPAFRTILDWEIKASEKKSSFWTMTEEERAQGGFPTLFDREVYDAMLARFSFVTSLNPASPILNFLNVDSGGAVATFSPGGTSADAGRNGTAAGQNGGQAMVAVEQQKPSGRKRKNTERAKQSPAENNKKVMMGLIDPKEEAGGYTPMSPGREARESKSKNPLDIVERRLLLEEKKMKLAEQRFSLEEKKLEATIEIGKGLIASMERMTGTISGLSPPPPMQQ